MEELWLSAYIPELCFLFGGPVDIKDAVLLRALLIHPPLPC